MNIPDLTSASYNREVCVKKHFPEFYQFMLDNYPKDLPWKEKIYWYLHNISKHPVCRACGKPTNYVNPQYGYTEYCSVKCSNSAEEKKSQTKETCKERYGGIAPATSKQIRQKMQDTCLERYGVKNAMQNEELKNKSLQTNIELHGGQGNASESNRKKYENTCIEKYGVSNPMKSEQCREYMKSIQDEAKKKHQDTIKKTYGVDSYSKTLEYKQKVYETKKKNHTFNSSKIEQDFKDWLDSNYINYKYQYLSEEYPFICDFYFPDINLYFEIQGSWTHNDHPYNQDSPEDAKTIKEWIEKNTKFYDNAVSIWSIRDPMKRSWALEHKLSWAEVFSNNLDEVIQHYNEHARVRTTE